MHRDVDVTAELLNHDHPRDGDAWRTLHQQWLRIGDALVEALLTPYRRCVVA